jgi:hypothetical protein
MTNECSIGKLSLQYYICILCGDAISSNHKKLGTITQSYKHAKIRRMVSSAMLCHVALVRTDDSEESSTSIIRVTRIGELGTTEARCEEILSISSQCASVASCN